jgi:hypothetical protein
VIEVLRRSNVGEDDLSQYRVLHLAVFGRGELVHSFAVLG